MYLTNIYWASILCYSTKPKTKKQLWWEKDVSVIKKIKYTDLFMHLMNYLNEESEVILNENFEEVQT